MAEKRFNGRIVLKHDVESNWKLATGFTPMAGEVVIYDKDDNCPYMRIKIGDGIRNVNHLPFYADSWDNLSNKPFGLEYSTIIEWNDTSNETTTSSDGTSYKVSGLQPTSTELVGGQLVFSNGDSVEITSDMITGQGYIISVYNGAAYINTNSGSAYDASLGMILPSPGIYFKQNVDHQIIALLYGNRTINYIDEKYIPDTIARLEDIPACISVDQQLSATSENPVQNKVVNEAITQLNTLVGDSSVSEQISASQIVYVGPTEPEDKNIKVWIKTSEEGTGVVPILPRISAITLNAAGWTGNTSPYRQVVSVDTVTSATKIDLQPTVAQIIDLQNQDIALMAENIDGTVTIYSFGGKPKSDMTMQVQLTEVSYI